MNQTEKFRAIQHIRPGAEFVLRDNKIEWFDKTQIEPTSEELEAALLAYYEKKKKDELEAIKKRESALAKLVALGLEVDDLKALGLQ